MKKILVLLFFVLSITAHGQGIYSDYPSSYQYAGLAAKNEFLLPADTVLSTKTNVDKCRQLAKKNGVIYSYNCTLSKWVAVGTTPTWQDVMTAGNTTTTDAILDGGGSFGNLRLSSRYNGSNRLYSMTTGAGSFKPFQILSGGLMVSDRAGGAASDNGTDALQVMGSTLTNGLTSNGSATFNSTVTVSTIASSLLKTDGSGRLFPAVSGTDYAAPSGSGNYIQNQISGLQPSSSFWVGAGIASGITLNGALGNSTLNFHASSAAPISSVNNRFGMGIYAAADSVTANFRIIRYSSSGGFLSNAIIIEGATGNFGIGSSGMSTPSQRLEVTGKIKGGAFIDSVNTAIDANYSVQNNTGTLILPTITAARQFTVSGMVIGQILHIWNKNTSTSFQWSLGGTISLKDAAGNNVTLSNGLFYTFFFDGTNLIQIGKI